MWTREPGSRVHHEFFSLVADPRTGAKAFEVFAMSVDAVTPAPKGQVAPAAHRNGAQSPELHDLLNALEAVRAGDFSVRLPRDRDGTLGRISVLFNEIVAA